MMSQRAADILSAEFREGSTLASAGWKPAPRPPDFTFIASPGAVPLGLGSTVAPSGTIACTSLFAGMGRLRTAK